MEFNVNFLNDIQKKECSLEELCAKFSALKKELSKNFQIGFSCETVEEAVLYGLDLLKHNLNIKKGYIKIFKK